MMNCISKVAPRGIKIVQHCSVSPPIPKGGPKEQLLPLASFDIVRLHYHLVNFLFFYKLDCSESHFKSTIVPNLNTSLSLALKHFLPLAGKIVVPLTPSALLPEPVCRYVTGDSVSVEAAVSDVELDCLTDNHSRDADQFRQFLPQVLPHAYGSSSLTFAPLAIQATLFPHQGICIGQTLSHAIADGATMLAFKHAWASINKFNGDAHLGAQKVCNFDRTGIVVNKELTTRAWNHMKASPPTVSLTISLPTDKVRATFSLSIAQIQKLKSIAVSKNIPNPTSLVVLSGYLWSCLAKSAAVVWEEVGGEEAEYLTCTADIRARFCPPLPSTYFGNCTVILVAESTHGKLKGENGYVEGARAIGEAIHVLKSKTDNVFDDLEERIKLKGKRVVTIAGSPRFDYYGVDYGWGRPIKMEYPTNDCDGSVLIYEPNAGTGGGIEISMSMPKLKMDAFATFFHLGITETMRSYS